MVALCFRYHEGLLKAREHLRSGRVGRPVSIRAMVGENLPEVRPDYRTLFSFRYAGVFDLIHEVDLAAWFADLPVRRVLGISGTYSDVGIEAPDLAEMIVDFGEAGEGLRQGCLASIHLDFFQQPRRRQIELTCTRGTIIVEFAPWDRCAVSVYEAERKVWEHEELPTQRDDMFRAEDREFLEAIARDKSIVCTIAEGLKSVEIVAQTYTFPDPPGDEP
jgi:predicted dehydrogenase